MNEATPARAPLIIWGNRKLIRQLDRAVRQARQHPALANKPFLARGVCTLVFDAGSTVLKLTVDGHSHGWAAKQAEWRCAGLPATGALHGQVGVSETGAPLWLFEQEKLTRLPQGSSARKQALHVGRLLRGNLLRFDWPHQRLLDAAPQIADPVLAEAVTLLADYAEPVREELSIDLHASNVMLRPGTGQPVISDPFVDLVARHRAQQHSLIGSKLPANTVFI